MKTTNNIVNTAMYILTGFTFSSMVLTHSDRWMISLPILLMVMSFKLGVLVKDEE